MDFELIKQFLEILINSSLAVALVVFFIITSYFKDKKADADHEVLLKWIREEMTVLLQNVSTVAQASAEALRTNTLMLAEIQETILICRRQQDDHH